MGFQLRVLVVDPDQGSRMSLVDGLAADGHLVDISNDDDSAVARSMLETPDAVLLGYTARALELARALRRNFPDVVIIVLTERHLRLEAGLDHDVDYEVVSPFDVDLLSGLLYHLRGQRRSQPLPVTRQRHATGS